MSSLLEGFNTLRLVKTSPSLKERIEHKIAAAHHQAVVSRLRHFREELERQMAPEPWMALEAPMATLLADVCNTLGLDEQERAVVLGGEGAQALTAFLESRPMPRLCAVLNERQAKAMIYVQKHKRISLREYRKLCPHWSDETLRLDLYDLVQRELLIKNGDKKGTNYTPAE
jgi:hypothetical protein